MEAWSAVLDSVPGEIERSVSEAGARPSGCLQHMWVFDGALAKLLLLLTQISDLMFRE